MPGAPHHPTEREEVSTSPVRYWETRRLPYNLVLLVVFLVALAPRWRVVLAAFGGQQLLELLVLAALANLCYSAAYLADLVARLSGLHRRWPRWRCVLWVIGTLFAAVLTLYWTLDEILPGLGT
jgi:amino acid transporter